MVNNVSGSSSTPSNIGSTIVNSITGGTIDIQTLADNLTSASKVARQSILDGRKQVADAKISSIGKITAAANDFQTALNGLGDPRSLGYTPQTTNAAAADFAFQSFVAPKPVNLSFVVKQLAKPNTVSLPPINSKAALIGSAGADQGTITITKLDGSVIDTIDFAGTKTLADLSTTINDNAKTKKTGLSATILNGPLQSDGSTAQNLTISNGSGAANKFIVSIEYKKNGASLGNSTFTQSNLTSGSGYNVDNQTGDVTYHGVVLKSQDVSSASTVTGDVTVSKDGKISSVNVTSTLPINANGETFEIDSSQAPAALQNGSGFAVTLHPSGLQLNQNTNFNQSSGQDAIIATDPYTDVSGKVAFQNTFNSPTNQFSNLVSGININVHGVTADDAPVTIATEQNTTGLLGALQTIVDGYNKLLASVQSEIKYDSDVTKRGGLANESVAKNFIQNLQQLTTKAFPDGNGSTFTLADIGVKTNIADGSLSIDTAIVSQVQQTRPELFTAVLTSKSANQANGDPWKGPTGALDQMITLNNIVIGTGSVFSTLLNKTQTVDEQAISDDQTKLDDEMTALRDRYLNQFAAMQNLLNSSKSDQSSLTNMMASWSAGLKA